MPSYYKYVSAPGAELFTVVCLPSAEGQYPTVITRSPYVDADEALSEEEICARMLSGAAAFLEAGYAVVSQHCRGRGKSSGDCVPYIYEREDGLLLQEWVRRQSFYNGELYLCGASYTASVHLVTAPFAEDVKGAVFEVQDAERYNCNYRNGFFKVGLHGGWYVNMYKKKSGLKKSYTADAYRTLPLSCFSRTVLGESAEDLDETLRHPKADDPFWDTRYGGGEARHALRDAGIPILLVTGFYDIYTGGVFDMWRDLDEKTRSLSALLVHPFDHGGSGKKEPIEFENATAGEAFGSYKLAWLQSVRGKCRPPIERGKVTYYRLFEGRWQTDRFYDANATRRLPLGEGSVTYTYNPYAPATFPGGLSTCFGGNAWQPVQERYDVITVYTPPFEEEVFVKGKMRACLRVRSDCEDTCFYLRVSLVKEEGDYGLRDDINAISNFDAAYVPGRALSMSFSFDEHAFRIQRGERLRIDVSSSAWPHYVPHTNRRGLFSEMSSALIAKNTVELDASYLELPLHVVGKTEKE